VDDCSNYDAAMIRRLPTLLLLAVAGTALLAGCGGKSSTGTTTVTSNPSVATGKTGATPTPTPTPAQEVAVCQRSIERIKTLPASAKTRLKSSCEKVGTGQASKRQVVKEACLAMALQLPSAVARARAQKICSAP
jgi:zona occludens toxin (predicted ATPase)